jgi:hypothetical protein
LRYGKIKDLKDACAKYAMEFFIASCNLVSCNPVKIFCAIAAVLDGIALIKETANK